MDARIAAAGIAVLLLASVSPADVPPPAPVTPCVTLDDLLHMTHDELECLYRSACPGEVPHGYFRGHTIRHPGSKLNEHSAKMNGLLWKGKLFGCECMINRWCGDHYAVPARVACEPSWLDGKPSTIMDYQGVSKVIWKDVRDEIRQVGPGVYLGLMYQNKHEIKFKMFFALELADCE